MYEIAMVSFVPHSDKQETPERSKATGTSNVYSGKKADVSRAKRCKTKPTDDVCDDGGSSVSSFGVNNLSGDVEYFTSFDFSSKSRDIASFALRE